MLTSLVLPRVFRLYCSRFQTSFPGPFRSLVIKVAQQTKTGVSVSISLCIRKWTSKLVWPLSRSKDFFTLESAWFSIVLLMIISKRIVGRTTSLWLWRQTAIIGFKFDRYVPQQTNGCTQSPHGNLIDAHNISSLCYNTTVNSADNYSCPGDYVGDDLAMTLSPCPNHIWLVFKIEVTTWKAQLLGHL